VIEDDYFGLIEYSNRERGIIPETRVILARNLDEILHNLTFGREELEKLILTGKIISGFCNIETKEYGSREEHETGDAYRFRYAKEEWEEVLNEADRIFSAQEVLV
jgi:hypothetical protein